MSIPQEAARPSSATQAADLGQLHNPENRERLSGPAFKLFAGIAEKWSLTVDQRCRLLGDISRQTYHSWSKNGPGRLSRDQLERISLLLGIHKALKLIFVEDQAGIRWLKSTNSDFPFANRVPVEKMLDGGVNDLYSVRRYLDAWRGGK